VLYCKTRPHYGWPIASEYAILGGEGSTAMKIFTIFGLALTFLSLSTQPADADECANLIELKQYNLALAACKKATEQENKEAQFRLGKLYLFGVLGERKPVIAADLLSKSSNHGMTKAAYLLGSMCLISKNDSYVFCKKISNLEKSLIQEGPKGMNLLGMMYQQGRGISKSDSKATEWYKKAAAQGDANAQMNLGYMYQYGQGVERNQTEAFKWTLEAAKQGLAQAKFNIGLMSQQGQSIKINASESANWLKRAAESGVGEAALTVGLLYGKGQGVPQDINKSSLWCFIASGLGPERVRKYAQRCLEQSAKWLTQAQVQDAYQQAMKKSVAILIKSRVGKIQTLLYSFGYTSGPADGMAGPQTFNAIKAFQGDAGIKQDGKPSENLLNKLRDIVQG